MRVSIYDIVEVATFHARCDSPTGDSTKPQTVVLTPVPPRPVAGSLVAHLEAIEGQVRRIADALAPAPVETVGTRYVADRLGLKSTQRVAQLIGGGVIPADCILPRTGRGGRWQFHRERIERWIDEYRRDNPR